MNKSLLRWIIYLLLGLLPVLCFAGVIPTRVDSLLSCLSNEGVPFEAKGSTKWNQEITPFNLRLAYNPAAVANPRSIYQIKAAVCCGVNNGVRVSAKSGGHSFGSFCFGGEDGHLVIDLNRMYEVSVNADNIATVQSGARLGHVALELYKQGERAIAHGSCPE
jgi:FAD/FMN-containing dehydrogenase